MIFIITGLLVIIAVLLFLIYTVLTNLQLVILENLRSISFSLDENIMEIKRVLQWRERDIDKMMTCLQSIEENTDYFTDYLRDLNSKISIKTPDYLEEINNKLYELREWDIKEIKTYLDYIDKNTQKFPAE